MAFKDSSEKTRVNTVLSNHQISLFVAGRFKSYSFQYVLSRPPAEVQHRPQNSDHGYGGRKLYEGVDVKQTRPAGKGVHLLPDVFVCVTLQQSERHVIRNHIKPW